MAYIYQITNDINGKIYIGKTEFSVEKRFQEHCSDSQKRTEEHRPLYAAMRKYGTEHFHVETLEETDNPEDRERYWIETKGSFKNGYNATLGGDGKKYLDYELIIKTYEEVQDMSAVARIVGCDSSSVKKVLQSKGVNLLTSKEVNVKVNGRPVGKFSREGVLLKTYRSIQEAARDIDKHHAHISQCANGQRKTAYGFIWKFL